MISRMIIDKQKTPKLGIYKMFDDVVLPEFATDQAACFDLRFYPHGSVLVYRNNNKHVTGEPMNEETEKLVIAPDTRVMVPTGIIMDIPKGYSVRLHSRSSLALKSGLRLANSEGVIDSDYVDEVMVLLHNYSHRNVEIVRGERICQAELVKNQPVEFVECKNIPERKGNRKGGFGSTGKE